MCDVPGSRLPAVTPVLKTDADASRGGAFHQRSEKLFESGHVLRNRRSGDATGPARDEVAAEMTRGLDALLQAAARGRILGPIAQRISVHAQAGDHGP